MNNNINFKANYVKPITIKQYKNGIYKSFNTSLVKYDVFNKNDSKAIETIATDWGTFSYAKNIFTQLKRLSDSQDLYLLTLPQESYENINSENILGCVLVNKKPSALEIKYLQVNPKYTANKRPVCKNKYLKVFEKFLFGKKDTLYKNIGREILNSMKSIYSKHSVISLISDRHAENFYYKNGFKKLNPLSNILEWYRNSSINNKGKF